VLVMISSMSLPICNLFQARRANSSEITHFRRGPFLTAACADLLELRKLVLGLLKSTFNANKN